jgi:hypothetical protein
VSNASSLKATKGGAWRKPSDKGVALGRPSAYDAAISLRLAGSSVAEEIFRRLHASDPVGKRRDSG